jgi:hypothetical protein
MHGNRSRLLDHDLDDGVSMSRMGPGSFSAFTRILDAL